MTKAYILYCALLRESYRIDAKPADWDNPDSAACVLHEELERLHRDLTADERGKARELTQQCYEEREKRLE